MEYLPIVNGDGKPSSFVAIVNDIVKEVSSGKVRWWFWIDDVGVDVSDNVKENKLVLGNSEIDLGKLFDDAPWLFARTVESVDEYALKIMDYCRELRGKKVSQAFSGGKDSTIALATLVKLREVMDFELDVIYVHMPFIEPLKNVSEALRIARKLGVELTILEPPRKEVIKELDRSGLPKRGCRLCTYIKVAPIRYRAKALSIDIQAYGDRIWEAGKRFERLFYRFFLDRRLLSKHLGFTVIAPLTIVDVVELCRALGTVHYMYLEGSHRVSCIYCPQKPVFELCCIKYDLEDPGLIDSVLRKEWRKLYRDQRIGFEEFLKYHLWRFTPKVARNLLIAKTFASKLMDRGVDYVKASEFLSKLRSPWIYGIKAPRVEFDKVFEVFRGIAEKILEHRRSKERSLQ